MPVTWHTRRCEKGEREIARPRLPMAARGVAARRAGRSRCRARGRPAVVRRLAANTRAQPRPVLHRALSRDRDGARVGPRRAGPRCRAVHRRGDRGGRAAVRADDHARRAAAPSSLGPYAVYVVWAATPSMDLVRRLGVVTAGRTRLDAIDFDKFIILVSAERSGTVRSRGPHRAARHVAEHAPAAAGADPVLARRGARTAGRLARHDWPRPRRARRHRAAGDSAALDDGPDAAGADDAAGRDDAAARRCAVPASRRIDRGDARCDRASSCASRTATRCGSSPAW